MSVKSNFTTVFYDVDTKWSLEKDEQVKRAIVQYNRYSIVRFPEDPFQSLPFPDLKDRYLGDLNKSAKQIRERWVTHICLKIRSLSVLEKDQDMVLDLCKKNLGKWATVAKKVFEVFHGKEYYSDNTIKNFYMRSQKNRSNRKAPVARVENKPVKRSFSSTQLEDSVSNNSAGGALIEDGSGVSKKARFKSEEDVIELAEGYESDEIDFDDSLTQSSQKKEEEEDDLLDSPTSVWGWFVDPSKDPVDLTIDPVDLTISVPKIEPPKNPADLKVSIQKVDSQSSSRTQVSSPEQKTKPEEDILGCDELAKLFW